MYACMYNTYNTLRTQKIPFFPAHSMPATAGQHEYICIHSELRLQTRARFDVIIRRRFYHPPILGTGCIDI